MGLNHPCGRAGLGAVADGHAGGDQGFRGPLAAEPTAKKDLGLSKKSMPSIRGVFKKGKKRVIPDEV